MLSRVRIWAPVAALLLCVCATPNRADGSDLGIPLHPAEGDPAVSGRLPSNSTARITELWGASHPNWIRLEATAGNGWIVTKYVASVTAGDAAPSAPAAATTCMIGAWNLEWFHNGKMRGFPETPDAFPPRTPQQIQVIADAIGQLNVAFLSLTEINGRLVTANEGDTATRSEEMDALVQALGGAPWEYAMGASGQSQHIAFLYDGARVRVNSVTEFVVPFLSIEGSDIFARDPLVAHITLLSNGQARNDFVIVGLHLASGQDKEQNHDAAMTTLLARLAQAQASGQLGGTAEHDVILLGDLNASMFRLPVEQFFVDMDLPEGDWDVLASDDYPATRLSGNPLVTVQAVSKRGAGVPARRARMAASR